MDDTLTRAVWIDRFVMHTRALLDPVDPEETFAALTSSPQSCRPESRDSES